MSLSVRALAVALDDDDGINRIGGAERAGYRIVGVGAGTLSATQSAVPTSPGSSTSE